MTAELLNSLRAIVGGSNAFSFSASEATMHRKLFGAIARSDSIPVAVAQPGNVTEVQGLVKAAAKYNVTVWISPNATGNGAAVCRTDTPIVIVDLSRMNHIVEVNGRLAYALVEPGVTFTQLQEYMDRIGTSLRLEAVDDPEMSVWGEIARRRFGNSQFPYNDRQMSQCGLEVVLGNGEVIRTGFGAMSNSKTWQLSKYGYGPYVDGLFTQSDFAIVTKAGFWLRRPPSGYHPFMLTMAGHQDLAAVIDTLRAFTISMALPGTITVSHLYRDIAPFRRRSEIEKSGMLDNSIAAADSKLGLWNVFGAVHGLEEHVPMLMERVREAMKSIGGLQYHEANQRNGDPVWQDRERRLRGDAPERPLAFRGWGGDDHLTITAAAPVEGEAAVEMFTLADPILAGNGFAYLGEFTIARRTLFNTLYLPYTGSDPNSRNNAYATALDLASGFTEAGYGVIDESLQLRLAISDLYGDTPHARLVDRIRVALATTN